MRARSILLFAAVFLPGLGLLLFLGAKTSRAPREGVRIRTVPHPKSSQKGDGDSGESALQLPSGAPSFKEIDKPRFKRYERVDFHRGKKTFSVPYLACYIEARQVVADTRSAIGVVVRLYSPPASLKEARKLAGQEPIASVVIRAGTAKADRVFRPVARTASTEPGQWVLELGGGVEVSSAGGPRPVSMSARDLVCYATERRIVSKGPVKISSASLSVTGTGFSGDAALGTFTVSKDVVVSLPTAMLTGKSADSGSATTRVHAAGPLLVERLGETSDRRAVRSRVTFRNGVRAVEDRKPGRDSGELKAQDLVVQMTVPKPTEGKRTRPKQQTPQEGAPEVTVEEVKAVGDAFLEYHGQGFVRAAALTLTRKTDAYDIDLSGPITCHFEGAALGIQGLGAQADKGAKEVLDITAQTKGVVKSRAGAFHADFSGNVVAHRRLPDGTLLLTLRAKRLDLFSGGGRDRMTATGSTHFSTPTMDGSAKRLVWERKSKDVTVTRLVGDAVVLAEGGAGLEALSPTAGAPTRPTADSKARGKIRFSCAGPMDLETGPSYRRFSMEREAKVTRLVGGKAIAGVTADHIYGVLVSEELSSLTALGSVVANGRSESGDKSVYSARGESFRYRKDREAAVLAGAPAQATIQEGKKGGDTIRAPVISYFTVEGRMVAEGGVDALVYVAGKGSNEVRPVHLSTSWLELRPARDNAKKGTTHGSPAPKKGGGAAGRLASVDAVGSVVMTTGGWTGRGDEFVYRTRPAASIQLLGSPARLDQTLRIAGHDYEDRFEAGLFRLGLKGDDLESFNAPFGGSFVFYRPYAGDEPKIMGASGGQKAKKGLIERLSGGSKGPMTYAANKELFRMIRKARVSQSTGLSGRFETVAAFTAKEIDARLGLGPKKERKLLSVSGEGDVSGNGKGWDVVADSFTVDFEHHRTTVRGSPAVLSRLGQRERVGRAVYDYEKDEWVELFQVRGR